MEKQKNTITIKLQRWFYGLAIKSYRSLIRLASLRSSKAQKWIDGRRDWRNELREIIEPDKRRILLHAASLGEMEQGLPILKRLREAYPKYQIILSFYSPSGYEHFGDRELCDAVIYLPEDTRSNAYDFAEILQADLALFIKYEIWPNLIEALKVQACTLVLAPAVFRANQLYFKLPKVNWFSRSLSLFDRILVQNNSSLELLQGIGISNVSVCGDSRFERALENQLMNFSAPVVEDFSKKAKHCLIIGSSWPKEEEMSLDLLKSEELHLILAPHDVSSKNIERLLKMFNEFEPSLLSENQLKPKSRIIIVDGIGKLKFLYRFADLAFIGGGFGDGVHSTVEAAVYRIPIIFGPKHLKFPETIEMQELGFAASVSNFKEFKGAYHKLIKANNDRQFATSFEQYLQSKSGASELIFQACKTFLRNE